MRVGKFDQKHFGFVEMIADSDDENAFANFCGVDVVCSGRDVRFPPEMAREESGDEYGCKCSDCHEAARSEERFPPAGLALGQTRRDGGPDALTVIFTGIGHRQGIHGGENGFDFFERGAAFGAVIEMHG